MANKIRFDHQEALEMLSRGTPMGMIAKQLKVSRQAIYDLKRDQEKKDKKFPVKVKPTKTVAIIDPSLDQVEDWVIARIAAAKEVDRLRNQLAATKNELMIAQQELEMLRKKERERGDRDRRFALAKQQGEIGGADGH